MDTSTYTGTHGDNMIHLILVQSIFTDWARGENSFTASVHEQLHLFPTVDKKRNAAKACYPFVQLSAG